MKFKVELIPPNIIKHYNLEPLIHNGHVYAKINKALYGLKQAGKIANNDLIEQLAKHGYKPTELTEGLFVHETRSTCFTLVVDDFAVRYENQEDADHLINCIREKYPFKVDWEAKQYIGINLEWNYIKRWVKMSMKGYVKQALLEFKHLCPKQHHYGPSKIERPDYGQKIQYVKLDESDPMTAYDILHKQQVCGKFLFYARAIDNTMLHALNDIASAKNTKECAEAVRYFLNYAASNPEAEIIYRASDMILQLDSDAAYLVCPEARSRAGGYFFLGNKDRKLFNGALKVLAKIIKNVMASAAKAEVAGLYMNAHEAVPMRQALIEMGHP